MFDAQQPSLNAAAAGQQATYGRIAPGAEAGIIGAQGVVNHELDGSNLNGNPYIQGMIDRGNRDITNNVNGQFEGAGRYGSGMHAEILARQIGENENNMRFANYSQERQNQVNAVGQAANLMGGAQSIENNAAELPWIGVGALNGNVRQASNGYGTQTTTQQAPWGSQLLGAAGNIASAYASRPSSSDPRLKLNIDRVGTLPSGLGVYEWNYDHSKGVELPEGRFRGVMADEVEMIAPHLMGPLLGGYKTVYYTPERIG